MTALHATLILVCVGLPVLFLALLGYSLLVVAADSDGRDK